MRKTVLLTGGAGFIGHHCVEHILKNTDWNVIILDRLTYAGNLNRLTQIDIWEKEHRRVRFVYHDLTAPISEMTNAIIGSVDYIIHLAAESHVDRSIKYPRPFAESNVLGTVTMLDYAKLVGCEKMIYVSTDEVYGPAIDGHLHTEGEPHRPSNPYAASKSGAEAFCFAYWNTYNLPIVVSNTMNNFGQRQDIEKFVPKTLRAILRGEKVTLHCKKDNEGHILDVSSRCWLHARNHADALLFLLKNGCVGEHYNVVGKLADVGSVANMIARIAGKELFPDWVDFHSFRPGHDMHYGLNGRKLGQMGWKPPVDFEDSLAHTVEWTIGHPEWLGMANYPIKK